MTGAGMTGLTYFANHENDPYITLKNLVSRLLVFIISTHPKERSQYRNYIMRILKVQCYVSG